MNKVLVFVLSLSMAFMMACSSSSGFPEEVSCADIMNGVLEVTVHPEAEKIYTSEEDNLDTYSLSLWSDGLFQESAELSKLSDYAIYVSAGTTTYEVAVLRTEKTDDVSVLTDLIVRRKETLSLGDKGMYDPDFKRRMNSSEVITVGNTVIFVITDDNSAAKTAVNALK